MNSNEQNNTMLYVTIFVGLLVVGAVRGATLGFLEDGALNMNAIIAELIGGALTFGLLVFVVQQLSNGTHRLSDIVSQQKSDIEKLRAIQDKLLNEPTISRTSASRASTQSYSTPPPEPEPVVATPIASEPEPSPEPPAPAPEPEITDSRPSGRGLSAKDLMKQRDRFTTSPAPLSSEPVAAAPDPVPPASPKDTLETQIAQELDAFGFDEMFADYQQERDEAIASGKGFDTDKEEGFPE